LKNLWYDAVLDWGLNQGPPALDASTLHDQNITIEFWISFSINWYYLASRTALCIL